MSSRIGAIAAFILASLLGSCDRHSEQIAHEAQESVVREATRWFGDFEAFTEFRAPVVSEPVTFAIHLTKVDEGKPVEVERIALRFEGPDGAAIDAEALPGSTRGIAEATVVFDREGDWSLALSIPELSEAAIEPIPFVVARTADARVASDAIPGAIALTKEEQWALEIVALPAGEEMLAERRAFPAVVSVPPSGMGRVTAPTSGILLPPSGENFPALGHQVEAGQVVARLEPPLAGSDLVDVLSAFHELEVHEADLTVKIASARAEAERARAELRLAEAELERARSLATAQAKSERELREAEFRAEAARIAVDVAERVAKPYEDVQELLEGHPLHNVPIVDHFPAFELRAPVSGTIDAVRGTHGESVVEGTVLFEIVDPSEVFVEALVPETSVRSVRDAGAALVEVTLEDGSTVARKLERVHVGWRVDDARRVRVVYRASNDDGLFRAGEAVSVLVETKPASPRLSLPADAVVDDRGVPVVYVQVAGETFVRRPVEVGIRSDGRVEIRKGIELGERAVVEGAYLVRAASFGDAIPDHHH